MKSDFIGALADSGAFIDNALSVARSVDRRSVQSSTDAVRATARRSRDDGFVGAGGGGGGGSARVVASTRARAR